MKDIDRLKDLLKDADRNEGKFGLLKSGEQVGRGNIPCHYKRITLPREEQLELSRIGQYEIGCHFEKEANVFFTQALIAATALSGKYTKIGIVTPSQYGKSYLLGMLALVLAFKGHKVNIGAATADKTDIIMTYCMKSAARAMQEVKKALTAETLKKVDRLDQAMSKQRLSFPGRGSVQALTLGDTYQEGQTSHNKAVGESGMWIIDEAALCSESSMSELGRREFSSVDGTVEPLIMISNPHNPGYFYDFITKEELKPGECVIWMDALTMAQEGRATAEKVLNSDFAENPVTLQKYLLCELPSEGGCMFDDPVVEDLPVTGTHISVLGVDAAYKGKDNIEICHCVIEPERLYVTAVETIKKPVWVDGVTSQEIIDQIARIYHRLGCAMCYVDEGWGVWLKEGLVLRGVNAKGIAFGSAPTKVRTVRGRTTATKRYAATMAKRKRDEMHLDLRDLIEHRAIVFSSQAYGRIKEALPFISCELKPDGKIHVLPKAEIKIKLGHSPDALDAVLLAVHAAVIYSDNSVAYMTEEG